MLRSSSAFYLITMSLPFDATLKSIVAKSPGDFTAAFGLPAGEPTAVNVDLSTISAATDVALAYGKPVKALVDVNLQSGPDDALPRRLFLYNAALHFRHGVPVQSKLVLLRENADAKILTGKLTYGEGRRRIKFVYDVIRMWKQPVDGYLYGGLSALPMAVLCKMPDHRPLPESLRDVFRAILNRLAKEAPHAEAMRLTSAAGVLTLLRVPRTQLASIFEGVEPMVELAAYDEAFLEGETRGEVKGRHAVLLQLGTWRFGTADAAVEAELTAIRDLSRLERLTKAFSTAASWRELLATP
ncbi:MAG: hypothetical protein ACRC1K_01050 [Planctomycetia bacterium]